MRTLAKDRPRNETVCRTPIFVVLETYCSRINRTFLEQSDRGRLVPWGAEKVATGKRTTRIVNSGQPGSNTWPIVHAPLSMFAGIMRALLSRMAMQGEPLDVPKTTPLCATARNGNQPDVSGLLSSNIIKDGCTYLLCS